jgi:hypothetical protein
MTKLTQEQLHLIMQNWIYVAAILGLSDNVDGDNTEYIQTERMFIIGCTASVLNLPINKVGFNHMPPIVEACVRSCRPVSSVIKTGQEEITRLIGGGR